MKMIFEPFEKEKTETKLCETVIFGNTWDGKFYGWVNTDSGTYGIVDTPKDGTVTVFPECIRFTGQGGANDSD